MSSRAWVRKTSLAQSFHCGSDGGEKLADVAEPSRAEQCVGEGVHYDVGVGVAGQALLERNLDSAENQLAARFEPMKVVADPTAKLLTHKRLLSQLVGGVRTIELVGVLEIETRQNQVLRARNF